MSLHGTLEVNHNLIGTWSVRRLEELTSTRDEHEYVWRVEVRPNPLAPADLLEATGRLRHRYSDGAPALVAKVMEAAANAGVGVRWGRAPR